MSGLNMHEELRHLENAYGGNPARCAAIAMGVLTIFRDAHDEQADDEEALTDLLADLMHLCDTLDLDFDSAVLDAQRHHDAEVRGEG